MIAREVKRKKLVRKYAAKRKSLLDEFNAAKDPMERLEIHRKIQGLPRNSAPTIINKQPTEIKSKIKKKTELTVLLDVITIKAEKIAKTEKK